MPLYVKLDIKRSGQVYAWVRDNEVDAWGISVVNRRSVPEVLRALAKAVPIPKQVEPPKEAKS